MATSSPKNRALCCECGSMRLVARRYRGRQPANARPLPKDLRWCRWLRCMHCKRTTIHAVLQDTVGSGKQCVMEMANLRVDASRSGVRRLVAGLEADGVRIEWTSSHLGAFPDGTPSTLAVELSAGEGSSELVVAVWTEASPVQQLRALEYAVQVIDNPMRRHQLRDSGIIVR